MDDRQIQTQGEKDNLLSVEPVISTITLECESICLKPELIDIVVKIDNKQIEQFENIIINGNNFKKVDDEYVESQFKIAALEVIVDKKVYIKRFIRHIQMYEHLEEAVEQYNRTRLIKKEELNIDEAKLLCRILGFNSYLEDQ